MIFIRRILRYLDMKNKLKDLLNDKHLRLERYIYIEDESVDLTIRFLPNYWTKEAETKHKEAYEVVSDNGKQIFIEMSRENLEQFVSEIKDFLKIVDTELK